MASANAMLVFCVGFITGTILCLRLLLKNIYSNNKASAMKNAFANGGYFIMVSKADLPLPLVGA